MARRKLFRTVLFLVSGFLGLTVLGLAAKAAGSRVLVIPTDDGYGLSDCLKESAACGPLVAAAWCKAHGHTGTPILGPIAPQPSAIGDRAPAGLPPQGFAVTCGD